MYYNEIMIWIYVIIKEFFFFLRTIIESPRSFFPLDWKKTTDKTPILLVHGYMNFASVWLYMGPKLFKKNFGSIYTLNLKTPFNSIEEFAKRVKEKALQIEKIEKTQDLIIIGHSMGGVVSLYYSLHVAKKNSVKKLITIGSPLRGTAIAKIGIGKCSRQMERESPFLDALHKEYSKHNDLDLYHIGTKHDQLIIPYTSFFLSDNWNRHFLLENMGHIQLIFSKKVLEKIAYWVT